MKVLKNLNTIDQEWTNAEEKGRYQDFKQEIGEERKASKQEKEKEKADALEKRKNLEFVKVGKVPMLRSTKPTIKKQEVKQTVDQETLDNLKYLGDLDDLVAQAE